MTPMNTLFYDWLDATERTGGTRYRQVRLWENYCVPIHLVGTGTFAYADVERVLNDMQYGGQSRGTIKSVYTMLNAMCTWGVRRHYMTGNAVAEADHPRWKPDGEGIEVPTPDEVQSLLDAAHDWIGMEFYTFLVLSCALGTRRSETCALRWNCVDFGPESSILIDSAIEVVPGKELALKATKTGATARLSVGEKTVSILADWAEMRTSQLVAIGVPGGYAPNSFVFAADPRGDQPRHPQWATNLFQRARDIANLRPEVTLKSLRHYHATQLISHGVDVRTVAGRLRHANPSTTLTYYAKFDKRADRAAADIFDAL